MNIGLLAALVGIAVVDSLNPSLFMGQFFLLTQPRPVPRSLQYIAGILTVNGMGGLLILAGIRASTGPTSGFCGTGWDRFGVPVVWIAYTMG